MISLTRATLLTSAFIAGLFLLFTSTTVLAQTTEYVPLEPLPKALVNSGGTQIATFVENILRVAIGLGSMLAVFLLVVGGIQYMTSDAFGGKDAGKSRMQNAIWGLLVLISVVLILYIINPNLLNFNFVVGPARAVPQNQVVPGSTSRGFDTAVSYCEAQQKTVRLSLDGKNYICQ